MFTESAHFYDAIYRAFKDYAADVADGADGIRRGQRLLDDIARFERE